MPACAYIGPLAQGHFDVDVLVRIGLWLMLAAAAILAGLLLALAIKRRLQRDELPEPFTLEDLRKLRANQDITEQEFVALRARLLGRTAWPPPTPTRPSGPGSPPDD
jgi:hypothetical protein